MKKTLLVLIFLLASTASFAQPEWVGTALVTGGVVTDNTLSAAVLLPQGITSLAIVIPTITSATVSLKVSHDGTTYQNYLGTNNGTNQILWSTAAATGAVTALVPGNIGLWKYVKVLCGAAQAADRTFTLIGK